MRLLRPDLVPVVVDSVGLSNPLRSELVPNEPPNIAEFESIKTQAGFEDLYAMDSYHHVRPARPCHAAPCSRRLLSVGH